MDRIIVLPFIARQGQSKGASNAVSLDESGFFANLTLVPGGDGKLTVHKTTLGCCIDRNGAPWLRRQALSLTAGLAVQKTDMLVEPLEVLDRGSKVTIVFTYITSHSFGELIFANIGARSAAAAIADLPATRATTVLD
ncbi:hypothetical protein DL768_005524 [Monosporascus sp. mg162]|nr:hypothetical protein DL768_005524 [Monosporascus sp. mg162]